MKTAICILTVGVGLAFAGCDGTDSGSPWQISTVAQGSLTTSIGIGTNDHPRISFHADNALGYAQFDGASWQVSLVQTGGVDFGSGIALAVDPDDYAHISYSFDGRRGINYTALGTSGWTSATLDKDDGGHLGSQTAISISSSGSMWVVYGAGTVGGLKYVTGDGTNWANGSLAQLTDSEIHVSMALDTRDYPHIVYEGDAAGERHIRHVYWNGLQWLAEDVDTEGSLEYPSIAVDSHDRPHVCYYSVRDSGGNETRDLKYARKNGPSWDITTIDSDGDVGLYNAIAVDSASRPHISYVDASNHGLKYAYFDGAGWNIESVDVTNGVEVGWQTSIALGTNNQPHISYFDVAAGSLKYAHR